MRATIGLPGLPLGREVLVDPSDPYMANCLERGYLQRIQTEGEATEPEADGGATAEDVDDAAEAPG